MRKQWAIAVLIATGTVLQGQQATLPLWPNGTPEPWQASGPEHDTTTAKDQVIAGKPVMRITDVQPQIAVYEPPEAKNTGAAVVVFPGGAYRILAYDLEGTEVCTWLNSLGIACVLTKYRVPVMARYPESTVDLEDAQQAMRLTRMHAAEWHIDPTRIGVLGFSAGGHLAVVLSNHADYQPTPANPLINSQIDARPNFAMVIYPGYLNNPSHPGTLSPGVEPNASTPPTFLVQAEDDPVHEENALYYFQALKEAHVPAELHLFAQGGHGYGLRPTDLPVTHWPVYAEVWLHTIHVLGPASK